jgi:hypothetical protein
MIDPREMEEAMADIPAVGLDIGTAYIQCERDNKEGTGVVSTTVRDCYCELPYEEDFEDVLKGQGVHYIKDEKRLYILGEDAFKQAGMSEFTAKPGEEILKRPMRDGILNPSSPKMALMILRALLKACVEKGIGPARPGEVMYFSVPAAPIDSGLDPTFHSAMCEQFFRELGYDARPFTEGLAVIFGSNPRQFTKDGPIPFTGIGISHGAGMVNFCFAERGRPIHSFSLARSGDWIDERVALMTGEPKTKITRVKERKLDFNKIGNDDPILMALDVYYTQLVSYIFGKFAEKFSGSKGFLEDPIEIVLSGGTASPPGFDKKVKSILAGMDFPFKVQEVRLAGNGEVDQMLKAVAHGCYIRAKQTAKKMGAAKG